MHLLKDADIVFGNLEGALIQEEMKPQKCSERSRNAATCYEFGMPEYLAPVLKELGFNVLNQDNNHSEDYGLEGYTFTQKKLEELGIKFMPKQSYEEFTVNNTRIAIVAFGYSDKSYNISDLKNAISVVSGLVDQFDIIIVSFHGGAEGREATHVKNINEVFLGENRGNVYAFAHTVIYAGADMVIGHGPHVLRAMEIYKNKLIAYSLGNFLTYGNMNINGINGVNVILEAELDSATGEFERGNIIPVEQVGNGVPVYDTNGKGVKLIQDLSQTDFPDSKLIILNDGTLVSPSIIVSSFKALTIEHSIVKIPETMNMIDVPNHTLEQ